MLFCTSYVFLFCRKKLKKFFGKKVYKKTGKAIKGLFVHVSFTVDMHTSKYITDSNYSNTLVLIVGAFFNATWEQETQLIYGTESRI